MVWPEVPGSSSHGQQSLYREVQAASLGVLHTVIASTVEIHDEHLIFCDSEGKLAALFLLEVVESWSELRNGE
jgi:hypothetical protein